MRALARIARLSVAFLGSNLVRGGLAFLLSLVIGRTLGIERFGRWILCGTWASTLTIAADLGFGLLLPRDGARKSGDLGALCASAIVVRSMLVVPLALAAGAAAGRLGADAETVAGLRVAAVVGASGAIYGCFGAAFRSRPAWVPAVLTMETTWHAAQLGVTWWLLLHAAASRIAALMWIAAAAQLLQIVSALVLWRLAFERREPIRLPAWLEIRAIFVRALPFAAAGLIANLQTRIVPLMLGYLSTETELGSFAAAARFGTTARLAPGAVFAGALPVLAYEHGRHDADARGAFVSFDRALALLALASALCLVVFARWLLRVVYGPPFTAAVPALVWIGIGLLPVLMNSSAKIALYAAGKERLAIGWSGAALAAQAAAALLLIPAYGAAGGAIAIAASEAIIWLPLRRACRSARTPARSSSHRAPASTFAPPPRGVADVPGPAAAR